MSDNTRSMRNMHPLGEKHGLSSVLLGCKAVSYVLWSVVHCDSGPGADSAHTWSCGKGQRCCLQEPQITNHSKCQGDNDVISQGLAAPPHLIVGHYRSALYPDSFYSSPLGALSVHDGCAPSGRSPAPACLMASGLSFWHTQEHWTWTFLITDSQAAVNDSGLYQVA